MRFSLIFLLSFLILVPNALAHCPLCTAATGAAVAVTRWYGLDDSIVGIFVGGMVVATGLWANNVLKKCNKGRDHVHFQSIITLLISFILTVGTLYFAGLVGPDNQFKIFGMDRILFGTLIGIAISFASFRIHDVFRMLNRNRNYIPYQSIPILILSLMIGSFIMYLVM